MSKCADGRAIVVLALLVGCGPHPGNNGGAGGERGGGGGEGGGAPAAGAGGGPGGARGDAGRSDFPAPADAAADPDPGAPDAAHFDFCDGYAVRFCERLMACSPPYL